MVGVGGCHVNNARPLGKAAAGSMDILFCSFTLSFTSQVQAVARKRNTYDNIHYVHLAAIALRFVVVTVLHRVRVVKKEEAAKGEARTRPLLEARRLADAAVNTLCGNGFTPHTGSFFVSGSKQQWHHLATSHCRTKSRHAKRRRAKRRLSKNRRSKNRRREGRARGRGVGLRAPGTRRSRGASVG